MVQPQVNVASSTEEFLNYSIKCYQLSVKANSYMCLVDAVMNNITLAFFFFFFAFLVFDCKSSEF